MAQRTWELHGLLRIFKFEKNFILEEKPNNFLVLLVILKLNEIYGNWVGFQETGGFSVAVGIYEYLW